MLWQLEWKNPHTRPFGLTLADWVASVRSFERKGWLRDPHVFRAEHWPQLNYVLSQQRSVEMVCFRLCWRERCRRAGRCKSRLPLAVRDFQPEYGVYFSRFAGRPNFYTGEIDPEKMEILAERCPCAASSGRVKPERPEIFYVYPDGSTSTKGEKRPSIRPDIVPDGNPVKHLLPNSSVWHLGKD